MKKPTCDELGICQARKRWLTPRRMDQLSIAILVLAFVMALVVTLALVSGHLTPGGLQ